MCVVPVYARCIHSGLMVVVADVENRTKRVFQDCLVGRSEDLKGRGRSPSMCACFLYVMLSYRCKGMAGRI
jgi:hypothetical protein